MDLLFATDEFVIGGIKYPGFPMLVGDDGFAIQPAFDFLMYVCIEEGGSSSPKTWASYGYAMQDFLRFLDATKAAGLQRRWDEPRMRGQVSVLAAYRDWSRLGGQDEATINLRLALLARFYEWALKLGLISALPFERGERNKSWMRSEEFSGQEWQHPGRLDVKLRKPRKLLKILSGQQALTLIEAIENRTHQLMVRLQMETGLRVSEVTSFPLKYVFDPLSHPRSRLLFSLSLSPADLDLKNGSERVIHIPRKLMAALWAYAAYERQKRKSDKDNGTLFLTEAGESFDRKSVWKIVANASSKLQFRISPHTLRHTYATHTLAAISRSRSPMNALLYVRDRLGHANLSTTEVYLHYLDDIVESVMDEYQHELCEALNWGGQ